MHSNNHQDKICNELSLTARAGCGGHEQPTDNGPRKRLSDPYRRKSERFHQNPDTLRSSPNFTLLGVDVTILCSLRTSADGPNSCSRKALCSDPRPGRQASVHTSTRGINERAVKAATDWPTEVAYLLHYKRFDRFLTAD
jgi:hypothetical protein